MPAPERTTPETDSKYHAYIGNVIPWYVRLLWVGFWILCISYILTWLVPALKTELVRPP
jgi:hypothetical protein